ncbi:MAG: MoaD/ThiS family protein [Bryobacterales bacterium]|nr:MoaD/ThiS family protein [Bryobacterales bacterium]
MATVFIPSMLQPLAGGQDALEVNGVTVREVVENLAVSYPGLRGRLLADGQLPGNISVAIDGEISTLGLLDQLEPDSEIHFVPAISGGRR